MPVHNNNVGVIANNDVVIKGAQDSDSTTLKGSLFGLRAVKDLSSGVITPANVDSKSLKDWFATYVGTIGKFNKSKFDNNNIKFSDYKGATILGFTVRVQNEVATKYEDNKNAKIKITPINGSLTGTPYSVTVGNTSTDSSGSATTSVGSTEIEFEGFEGGGANLTGERQVVRVTDTGTNATITMTWLPGYGNSGVSTIRGSGTVADVNQTFSFNWSSGTPETAYSDPFIFFLGVENTRPYGLKSTYEA